MPFSRPLYLSIATFFVASPLLSHEPSDQVASRFRNTRIQLQAHGLEDGAALGGALVHSLSQWRRSALLAQGYAFKGDADLGGVGAGLIFRSRALGAGMAEVNVFFDGLRDRAGYSYPQLGLGVAYSRSWFTARVNGYLPLRGGDDFAAEPRDWSSRSGSPGTGYFRHDWTQQGTQHASATYGFDAELELRLPNPGSFDPQIAIGYYYRAADDRSRVYSGLMVRGELNLGSNWSLEGEWRQDAEEIGQEYRIVLSYTHLFGAPATETPSAWMDRQWTMPAERRPWPSVARNNEAGSVAGRSQQISGPRSNTPAPVDPDDCCPSGGEPLIFE